jgi:hypothetical protein
MLRNEGAPFPTTNNVAGGAALYSTLASVLCGFAFTAIVLLVVTWLDGSSRAKLVLMATGRALVASFFGLLIMAVSYGAESTNANTGGLVISENTILAVGFVGVGVVLISTVVLMLDAADEGARLPSPHWRDVALFARAAACVLNLLVMGIGYNAVTLYEASRYGPERSTTLIDVVGWVLGGIQLIASVWASLMIIRRPAAGRYEHARGATQRLVVYVGFGFPVAAAVGYLMVDTQSSDMALIPPLVAILVLPVTFGATVSTTVYLALTRPARINPQSADRRPPSNPHKRAGTRQRRQPKPAGLPKPMPRLRSDQPKRGVRSSTAARHTGRRNHQRKRPR